ncbi:MAG: BrnA antitoxin family protein [Chloroflexi bacterium]|nr:BrnA antitoxin family protein [Chloroflexota bacterium]MBU1661939.1 BrnA antitoxin family protein [Chloroflexota bacterium]
MAKNKSSISKASSYEEIGEFWDSHDAGEFWDQSHPVEFEIDIQSSKTYFAVDAILDKKLCAVAKEQGISAETLLNLWVQEKLQETHPKPVYQIAEE